MRIRSKKSVDMELDKIVSEYLDKWPDLGSHTIARMVYEQNKEKFSSKDQVRSMVRYRRGKQGTPLRNSILNQTKGYAKPRF